MYPDQVTFENEQAILCFPPKWLEIEIHKDNFLKFIEGINALLDGSIPPENPNCGWCAYRHYGEKYSHLLKP